MTIYRRRGRFAHRPRSGLVLRMGWLAALVCLAGFTWHLANHHMMSRASAMMSATEWGASHGDGGTRAGSQAGSTDGQQRMMIEGGADGSTNADAALAEQKAREQAASAAAAAERRRSDAQAAADRRRESQRRHSERESQQHGNTGAAAQQQHTVAQAAKTAGRGAGSAAAASSQGAGGGQKAAGSSSSQKRMLFYDVGSAYHHLPECPPGWDRPGFTCDALACPVPWGWTRDKTAADAVIYNTLNGMSGLGSAPAHPGQLSVLFAMESGAYYPAIYTAKSEHGVNITADYRLDSDVPVTYYTRWEMTNLAATPVPFAKKRQDALVAAFISNCGARNNREEVLKKLMELLPGQVHSYGGCLHNKEAEIGIRSDVTASLAKWRQKMDIIQTYKFAFTPENSNDPGYVTEKLYHALEAGTVPIYIGAPDVQRLIPEPESVLQVQNFKSVEELADYIRKAGADEALYHRHVAWKEKPMEQWSADWQALERLTKYSAHCRIAMHMAGQPHKWRPETSTRLLL